MIIRLTIISACDIIEIYYCKGAFAMSEKDWKLFSKKYYEWKERYAAGRIEKYKKLLDSDESATDKFFELQKQIHKDSHSTVFRLPMRFSRSNMHINILALLNNGIITIDDLSEFSDEVKEMAEFSLRNHL